MTDMTDLEIVKRCAEKMGITGLAEGGFNNPSDMPWFDDGAPGYRYYDPLHDDAQAMALVKKFNVSIYRNMLNKDYTAEITDSGICSQFADLNRAICECVAKLPDSQPETK